MCDSLSITTWLDEMTDTEYEECQFPSKDLNDTDQSYAHFRASYVISPLTGARFKVTPIGMTVPDGSNKRALYGRIAGYQVSLNPPACVIGHNRQLANSVYQGAHAGILLLKHWLAMNGCTKSGLDQITLDNTHLTDVTLTYLYQFASETSAREALQEFREHTEALLNPTTINLSEKLPAYSYPPAPISPDKKYTYTSYVKRREFQLSAYVKERNQKNAFLKSLDENDLEATVQEEAERTLRLEIRVHGKWLADHDLAQPCLWRAPKEANELVFNLARETLRLNDGLRTRRFKKTTVTGLKLNSTDKMLLTWHLSHKDVRHHPVVQRQEQGNKRNKYVSAAKRRIFDETRIDITVPWKVQHWQFSTQLADLLIYAGEFKPAEHLKEFIFSRSSVTPALKKLQELIEDALRSRQGNASPLAHNIFAPLPKQTGVPAPSARGIGRVPIHWNAID